MDYRRDIDGLRTLAVVPVVIYHLKIPFGDGYILPGGFLGVDIFFVLSGFLITQIILAEMARTGRFSLRAFYARRARRILPALFLVILASVVAGVFILLPSEMARLAQSALAAVLFFSNGYWFFELQGYGSPAGLVQPLLHTWSLAVEEQFYLVFPLLLLLIRPAHWPLVALLLLLLLLVASLLVAEWTTAWLQPASFYSPLSRAWEMLAGAALALVMVQAPRWATPAPILRAVLPKLSVAVICVSMAMIDLDAVAHPGFATLPIVLATVAILWTAQGQEVTTRLLSTAPFVFIGRLSYSIYLWHFPVFAYGRLIAVDAIGLLHWLVWIALTMVLSLAGYYAVERPFRYALSNRAVMLGLSGGLVAITSIFLLGTRTDVLSTPRVTQLTALYGGPYYDVGRLDAEAWGPLNTLAEQTGGAVDPSARRPSDDEQHRLWFQDPSALNILIIGNSHSRDMFNVLDLVAQQSPGIEVARYGMLTAFPDFQRDALREAPNFAAADVILIATRYNENDLEAPLRALVAELQEAGKPVALVGNTAEFIPPARLPLFDYAARGGALADGLDGLNAFAYTAQNPRVVPLNARLRELSQDLGVPFLSRWDLLCSDAEATCTLRLPNGGRTLYDNNHLTLQGAAYVAEQIIETEWLAPALQAVCAANGELTCAR